VPLQGVYRHDDFVEHLAFDRLGFDFHERFYREDPTECLGQVLDSICRNLGLEVVSG
jgi:hypothetical protein